MNKRLFFALAGAATMFGAQAVSDFKVELYDELDGLFKFSFTPDGPGDDARLYCTSNTGIIDSTQPECFEIYNVDADQTRIDSPWYPDKDGRIYTLMPIRRAIYDKIGELCTFFVNVDGENSNFSTAWCFDLDNESRDFAGFSIYDTSDNSYSVEYDSNSEFSYPTFPYTYFDTMQEEVRDEDYEKWVFESVKIDVVNENGDYNLRDDHGYAVHKGDLEYNLEMLSKGGSGGDWYEAGAGSGSSFKLDGVKSITLNIGTKTDLKGDGQVPNDVVNPVYGYLYEVKMTYSVSEELGTAKFEAEETTDNVQDGSTGIAVTAEATNAEVETSCTAHNANGTLEVSSTTDTTSGVTTYSVATPEGVGVIVYDVTATTNVEGEEHVETKSIAVPYANVNLNDGIVGTVETVYNPDVKADTETIDVDKIGTVSETVEMSLASDQTWSENNCSVDYKGEDCGYSYAVEGTFDIDGNATALGSKSEFEEAASSYSVSFKTSAQITSTCDDLTANVEIDASNKEINLSAPKENNAIEIAAKGQTVKTYDATGVKTVNFKDAISAPEGSLVFDASGNRLTVNSDGLYEQEIAYGTGSDHKVATYYVAYPIGSVDTEAGKGVTHTISGYLFKTLTVTHDYGYLGIDGVNEGAVTVEGGRGVITVNGEADVTVYGIDGKMIYSGSNKSITCPAGVYVVKAAGATSKVVVL